MYQHYCLLYRLDGYKPTIILQRQFWHPILFISSHSVTIHLLCSFAQLFWFPAQHYFRLFKCLTESHIVWYATSQALYYKLHDHSLVIKIILTPHTLFYLIFSLLIPFFRYCRLNNFGCMYVRNTNLWIAIGLSARQIVRSMSSNLVSQGAYTL